MCVVVLVKNIIAISLPCNSGLWIARDKASQVHLLIHLNTSRSRNREHFGGHYRMERNIRALLYKFV